MKRRLAILLLATTSLLLGACNGGRYTGTYYPDPAAMWRKIDMGSFASLKDCRKAAQSRIDSLYQIDAIYRCDRR